ncbi:hypothetical protein GCM10022221_72040 [Actinocorallia aurea]
MVAVCAVVAGGGCQGELGPPYPEGPPPSMRPTFVPPRSLEVGGATWVRDEQAERLGRWRRLLPGWMAEGELYGERWAVYRGANGGARLEFLGGVAVGHPASVLGEIEESVAAHDAASIEPTTTEGGPTGLCFDFSEPSRSACAWATDGTVAVIATTHPETLPADLPAYYTAFSSTLTPPTPAPR